MPKVTKETENGQKEAFLESLKKGAAINEACEMANVARVTIWRWRKSSKEFNEEVLEILDSRTQTVEDALYMNAIKGNVVAQIFWLKNRGQERWKDKQEYNLNHSGEINSKLTHILKMEDEEIENIIDKYTKKGTSNSYSREEKKGD